METADSKSFTIRLKEPFPMLLDALARLSALVPFIMPERVAKTDPYQQATEMVGSGPFKFVKEEFQPGHMVVYVKNTPAAQRATELGVGRQGSKIRSRRMALCPRRHDEGCGAGQR
jgi:peptide/nickel transport system substrate-binding protein